MNLNNTLFILGAGASKPYGYPTAEELREELIKNYTEIFLTNVEYIPSLNDYEEKYLRRIKKLIEQFRLSHNNSIDLFLTRNKEKVDKELGIGLIWLSIIWYELRSSLRAESRDDDWYFDFFNELTADTLKKEELSTIAESKINFITFNYDRSLENFMYLSFMNSFSLTPDETKKVMEENFAFHHVYGKVADLDWESDKISLPYQFAPGEDTFNNCSKSINLIFDERKVDESVQDLIHKSHRIFFLGFGFAKANIEFLNLQELLTSNHIIYATGIGLQDMRINKVKSQLMRGLVGINDFNIRFHKESNCLQLLRDVLF